MEEYPGGSGMFVDFGFVIGPEVRSTTHCGRGGAVESISYRSRRDRIVNEQVCCQYVRILAEGMMLGRAAVII